MMNIVNCTRNPAEVGFPKMENMIQLCLKIEAGERIGSASELLELPALSSLATQLKNGISAGDLVFGKNRVETTEMISEKVNRENNQLKEEVSGLKAEIEKLRLEKEEIKKKFENEKNNEKKTFENEKAQLADEQIISDENNWAGSPVFQGQQANLLEFF